MRRRNAVGCAIASLVAASAVAGCYTPTIENGGIECSTAGECPSGYYCAADDHCWSNGTGPSTGGDAGDDLGGDDLAGADLGGLVATPTGLMTTPASPSNNLTPKVSGSAPAGTTVRIYTDATCSAAVAAQGSSDAFATGLTVLAVPADATTSFRATATDGMGHVSACSDPVSYVEDATAPAAPTLTTTTPPSPSASNTTPFVIGTAEAGATVKLFTAASCSGTVAAQGTAAQLASPGLQVSVGSGTTTTFYASATDAAGNVSACSTGLGYTEDPTLPAAPTNLHTNPVSPSNSATTFNLLGTALANTTIKIFTTIDCSGASVATGSSATFANPGFTLTVSANSINVFYANTTTLAGTTGPCSTAVGYIHDNVPPTITSAVVRDGTAADLTWQNASATMNLNWSGFADAASGIASYDVNLSTSASCTGDVRATSSAGSVATIQLNGLTLADGATYYNCVRAIDNAGNVSGWVASNGVTVDLTAPATGAAVVKDGVAADIQWQATTMTADANWSGFSDGVSGIASYDYNLSTTSACSGDVVAAVSTGASSSRHSMGLLLMEGVTYYDCARAIDRAGNVSGWVASNGFTIDTIAPSTSGASVRDSLGSDIQWQSTTSSAAGNWSGFTDGGSSIASYEVNLSSSNGCGADVAATRSVGFVASATIGSLALGSGGTYYFCVRARDNAGNASAWVASNGFTVDTTAPSAGVVRDGSVQGLDQTWQLTASAIWGTWSGFADAGSGIASYDWNVSTSIACAGDIVAAQTVGINTDATAAGLSLANATKYFNCTRAHDLAGNVGAWVPSNGVTVDIDLPSGGTVRDGVGSDVQWQKSTTTVDANWLSFTDATSGVGNYDHNLSTTTGCSGDVLATTSVAGTSVHRVGAALSSGSSYYNCVRANDNAGNQGAWVASNGFTVDSVAPVAGTVNDGVGSDVAFQSSINTSDANWSGFGDGLSGLVSYDWNLSLTTGCAGEIAQLSLPNVTSHHGAGFSLSSGTTYYNCVRAYDAAGNVTAWIASNGVTVDTTAPSTAGAVSHDGLSPGDITWQNVTSTADLWWGGFTDANGIAGYEYNLSTMNTCPGDVVAATGNGAALSVHVTGLSLTSGTTFYSCARAYDAAGNRSAWVSSNGVTVDSVAPVATTVRDGSGADIQYQAATTTMDLNWPGWTDAVSGIANYLVRISLTTACNGEILAATAGNVTTYHATVGLTDGTTYYNCVEAIDNAGNQTSWIASNGVTIDATKPVVGTVFDGAIAGIDATWNSSTTTMDANWSGFSDAASGLSSYEYNLSTTAGCAGDVIAATPVGNATSKHVGGGIALTDGSTYFNCVRARDVAGNFSNWAPSNGITVDVTQPANGTVNDGPAADQAWRNTTASMTANWSGFTDAGGITGYDWCLSTLGTCSCNIVAATNVGNVTTYTAGSLSLSSGATYYNCVRARDGAGNLGTWAISNGVGIDTMTPNGIGFVNDGASGDVNYQVSTTSMSANWSAGTDTGGSGIGGYDWNLSTTNVCSGDVHATVSLGNVLTTTQTVTVSNGGWYFNCVRARDNAGNVSAWTASNGVGVDTTAPPTGTVQDGTVGDAQWTNSTTSLSANWAGFNDSYSGTANYDYMVASDSACTTSLKTVLGIGNVTTYASSGLALTNGTLYYQCIRAIDAVGNTSAWVASNGITVDTTPPIVTAPSVSMADINHVTLTWTATDGQSGIKNYDVGDCQNAACSPSNAVIGITTATVTLGVSVCIMYGFNVTAHDVAGNSATTSTVYYTPLPPPVGTLTVVPAAGSIEWSISSPTAGASYQLCYSSMPNACSSGVATATTSRSADFVRLPNNSVGSASTFAVRSSYNGCFGTPTEVNTPQFQLSSMYGLAGGVNQIEYGVSTAIIGDVNGDGAADYVVGQTPGSPGLHFGSFFVYSGIDGTQLWRQDGAWSGTSNPFDFFGVALAGQGDVDGDAINDIIVGAPDAAPDNTNIYQGRFWAYRGGSTAPASPLCDSGYSGTTVQRRGASLAVVADVNGDGRADMLVGGPGNNATVTGVADVWSWAAGACTQIAGRHYVGTGPAELFATSVAKLGDLDGDGVNEYAVGAPGGGASGSGAVYIYKGVGGALLVKLDNTNGVPASSALGDSLANVGDVDGDGVADFIASGGSNGVPGHAVVFSGASRAVLFNLPGFQTNGGATSDAFGAQAGAAGDLDGDGRADFFVTAPKATVNGVSNAGAVYVFSGADGKKLYEYDGAVANEQIGSAAAGGLDINGDGRSDIVAGSWAFSSMALTNNGEAKVLSPLDTLRVKPAELWSPFGQRGYDAITGPNVSTGGSLTFVAAGGAGGSYSYNVLTPDSGAPSITPAGVYTAGSIGDVFDTVRVTDALHRTFDTRLYVRVVTTPPLPARPSSLAVTSVVGSTINLSFGNPAATPMILESRTPTQAWSGATSIASGVGTYAFGGAANTAYKIRLKAQKTGVADSTWSNEAAANTP